jgi:hypothetical protein
MPSVLNVDTLVAANGTRSGYADKASGKSIQ